MIPIGDQNPVLHRPVMTYFILALTFGVWILLQGGGLDPLRLAATVCNFGFIPAELTGGRPIGFALPMGQNLSCLIDTEPVNVVTPLTSMFLHGSWGHILGNALFFAVFGNNIEDSMGSARFAAFYVLCGLAAVGAHLAVQPDSPVPTVGASGAISGVLGAYLVLYPRVRVNMLFWFLFFIRVVPLPAWVVLLWWFGVQVITGLPQLSPLRSDISGGVAVWAHVGGFIAGVALVKLFESKARVAARLAARRQPAGAVGY